MIVLIGLLLLLCLVGVWAAMKLDEPRPRAPRLDDEEQPDRPWVHVETGPDSFHPVASWHAADDPDD